MTDRASHFGQLRRWLAHSEPVKPTGSGLRRRCREPLQHRPRFTLAIGLFCVVYAAIGGRLMTLGLDEDAASEAARVATIPNHRPDLVDRNGIVLATDLRTASLFAEPPAILDAEDTATRLLEILPQLDRQTVRARLDSDAPFTWLAHAITPRQEAQIVALGLPGIGVRSDQRRFYPGGRTAAHVTGHLDAAHRGAAGMERFLDRTAPSGSQGATVALSLDLRVQHVLRDELRAALDRHGANAAGGVILDAETGEVIAMASLPDYDPNDPGDALSLDRGDRIAGRAVELGSTFSAFTAAMALDAGVAELPRSKGGLTGLALASDNPRAAGPDLPAIFLETTQAASARLAGMVGVDAHQRFLDRLSLLTPLSTEIGDGAMPRQPRDWRALNSRTIAMGQGVATTPLQAAAAAAALVNGGYYMPPTFRPRSQQEAAALRVPVVTPQTARAMRDLFRLSGQAGTGRGASVAGYDVGGRAGVAEKIVKGRYSGDKRLVTFLGAFPMRHPRYVILVALDEPKRLTGEPAATAGRNVGPTTAAIVRRAAGLLGVRPDRAREGNSLLVSY